MRQILTIALLAVAMVTAFAAPGQAYGMPGHGGGNNGHHDGSGHHHHDGHHQGGHHGRPGFHGPFVYWNPYPVYVQPTFRYWYYCPSAGAYYPYVTYCLDAWVPVQAP